MSEMQRVALWNTTAGKPCGEGLNNKDLLMAQVGYIAEEVTGTNELYPSYRRGLEHDLLDGCGDVLVTAAGLLHLVGYDNFRVLPPTGHVEESLDELVDTLYLPSVDIAQDVKGYFEHGAEVRIDPVQYANMAIQVVCDILYIKGYDPEQVLKVVNDSNFTKFCTSALEAKASVHAYTKKSRYRNVKSKRVGKYWVIYGDDVLHGIKGKTLKGIHFGEPCFLSMIEQVNPDKLEVK